MSSFTQSATSNSLQRPRKAYSAKLCFLLDTTGSMHHVRDAVNAFILEVVDYCERKYPTVELKVGFQGYKDVGDRDRFQAFDFTADVAEFRRALALVPCSGGGDEAEDVLGGMNEALKLTWEHQRTDVKVLVHIGDSPHHGRVFHDGPVYDEHEELVDQPRPFSSILADYADGHIDYTFAAVKNPAGELTTTRMLHLFQESYDSNPARKSDFAACAIGEFTPKELFSKIKASLNSSIQMFMASVASTSLRAAMPSKKPAAKSAMPSVPEERSVSSVSSDSSGTSKGMDLALTKFASVEVPATSAASTRSTSISIGGLGGAKRPVSLTSAAAAAPSSSSSRSTSISIGGLGGAKKPVSSSAATTLVSAASARSSSISLGGLGAKRPAATA